VLTANAVELSVMGNEDMMTKTAETKTNASWNKGSGINGVALDKAAKPPRLFGMKTLMLDQPGDLLRMFGAIATRNTAATMMNDSSSRSHCFAFLTLYAYDPSTDTVRTSRFQFVDLAGNERMKDAHGKDEAMTFSNGNMEVINGLMTNFSLMMLSSCVRELVSARKKQKKKGGKLNFSFRSYLFDLVILLQESMIGSALTAIFVCVSQAPANAQTSKFSLEFGQVFSQLAQIKKKPVRSESRAKLVKSVSKALAESEAKLDIGKGGGSGSSSGKKSTDKFVILRQALVRDGRHMLGVLNRFSGAAGDSGDRNNSSAPLVQGGEEK
jgi:kinesin family protein 4/21/27